MHGWPIEKAKETMKYCIRNMNPNDTFQVFSFSNQVISLFNKPQPNNKANIDYALDFLGERIGTGGTQMLPAINAALAPPIDTKRTRIVCFMTDGGIGNDFEILNAINNNSKHSRFFTFSIGNSPNRYLLENMAKAGRGEVQFVSLEADAKKEDILY